MVRVSQRARQQLKQPLGELYENMEAALGQMKGKRVISVGDICTLRLLDCGIRPHLAVFDLRFMRGDLEPKDVERLSREFPDPAAYQNPAGSLSDEIMEDAAALLEKGGALRIIGEEDLCAIAFMLCGSKKDLIIYGQPGQGVVLVVPDTELKKKLREILSLSL